MDAGFSEDGFQLRAHGILRQANSRCGCGYGCAGKKLLGQAYLGGRQLIELLQERGIDRNLGRSLELDIASVAADGKVSAKLTQFGGSCKGSYDVVGSRKEGVLDLQVAQGPLQGCGGFRWVLKASGGKLVGTFAKQPVELSK
jgi:hypothetical protein